MESNSSSELSELEVRSKEDEAWYSAGVKVMDNCVYIHFEDFSADDDEVWDMAYLRRHAGSIKDVIRLSSPQLQDNQCTSVVVGLVVCARFVEDKETSGEGEDVVKYFDAKITKVDRRNSHTFALGEECCNCVFEAYWISGPLKNKNRKFTNYVLLSCGDICLPSTGDIEKHPVVKDIFRMLNSRGRRSLARSVAEAPKSVRAKPDIPDIKKNGRHCVQSSDRSRTSRVGQQSSGMKFREGHSLARLKKASQSKNSGQNQVTTTSTPKEDDREDISSTAEVVDIVHRVDIPSTHGFETISGREKFDSQKPKSRQERSSAVSSSIGKDTQKPEASQQESKNVVNSVSKSKKSVTRVVKSCSEHAVPFDPPLKEVVIPISKSKKKVKGPAKPTTPLDQPVKRMRGSVTNVVDLPAWYKPPGHT